MEDAPLDDTEDCTAPRTGSASRTTGCTGSRFRDWIRIEDALLDDTEDCTASRTGSTSRTRGCTAPRTGSTSRTGSASRRTGSTWRTPRWTTSRIARHRGLDPHRGRAAARVRRRRRVRAVARAALRAARRVPLRADEVPRQTAAERRTAAAGARPDVGRRAARRDTR